MAGIGQKGAPGMIPDDVRFRGEAKETVGPPLDSEQFRFGPRTFWPAYGRLSVRNTHARGPNAGRHSWWRRPDGRKPRCAA